MVALNWGEQHLDAGTTAIQLGPILIALLSGWRLRGGGLPRILVAGSRCPSPTVVLTSAAASVGRLLTAATVTLDATDPDHPEAQHCLRSYFTELQERFETGFDRARSLLPDAGELRPPHGVFRSPDCSASLWAVPA